MEMRQMLCQELDRMMAENENIVVIDADLSKPNGTYALRKKYPERAFDVGIAEQNMACVAAGMSSYGFIPFITSFTPFATRRICDQIAISIAYAGQNVKIIGTDPGISAEFNGGTHMSVEDLGVLRSIPNIVLYEPVDTHQLALALPQIVEHPGPVYIRMFRKAVPDVFTEPGYRFDLFHADVLQEGEDVSLFCSGIMVQEALKANDMLRQEGIRADILSIHTLKPLDTQAVIRSAQKTGAVVTAENHNLLGGLRSAVAETLAEHCPTPMRAVGIADRFGQVGKLPFLKEEYHMRAEDIVDAVKQAVSLK